MIEIVNIVKPKPSIITNTSNIEVGTVFIGKVGHDRTPGVYLRIYQGVVDLGDPSRCWLYRVKDRQHGRECDGFPDVTNYRKVNATLTIE